MAPSSTLSFLLSVTVLAFISQVAAHGTITSVTGANGVQGAGFGIIADTPRDGALPVPFEQDTSVIRDNAIASGQTGACGKTKAGGNNDVASQLAAASNAGLPTTSSAGELTMNLHQVNQDGAGPYTCDVSTDGGNTFQAATVTQNVPGIKGLSLATATDFPLTMQVATTTNCTGGPAGNACIARCRNPALAGPFGSCVAFTMGGAAAASNATASTAAVASDDTAATSVDAADTVAAASVETGSAAVSSVAAAATAASAAATPAAAAASSAKAAGGKAAGGKLSGVLSNLFGRKREEFLAKKRVINSRVAGANAGYWIDA